MCNNYDTMSQSTQEHIIMIIATYNTTIYSDESSLLYTNRAAIINNVYNTSIEIQMRKNNY